VPKKTAAADPSTTSAAVNADVAGLSYEQARDQLREVVQRLEAGGATLEESLALWERGEALVARCEQWLEGAQARLDAATGESSADDDEDDSGEDDEEEDDDEYDEVDG
jgi:exodeoxyribonuclease VII small subunit